MLLLLKCFFSEPFCTKKMQRGSLPVWFLRTTVPNDLTQRNGEPAAPPPRPSAPLTSPTTIPTTIIGHGYDHGRSPVPHHQPYIEIRRPPQPSPRTNQGQSRTPHPKTPHVPLLQRHNHPTPTKRSAHLLIVVYFYCLTSPSSPSPHPRHHAMARSETRDTPNSTSTHPYLLHTPSK